MTQPSLKVIGVYSPVISEETWQERFQVAEDEQATREHFEGLVLIEAVVEGLTDRASPSSMRTCAGACAEGSHSY